MEDKNPDLLNSRGFFDRKKQRKAGKVYFYFKNISVSFVPLQAFIIYWSQALETELSHYNIDVLTLTPSYLSTAMTAFSEDLNRPKLMVPSPQVSSLLTSFFLSLSTKRP